MWYLHSVHSASVIQKLTILECKYGLVLSNTRLPLSGTLSTLFLVFLCITHDNLRWQQFYTVILGAVESKDERGMFFQCSYLTKPTTNTPIPDRPARFLFLALIAKCGDEIFPNTDLPRYIHLKPWYTRHWPDQTSVRTNLFAGFFFLFCLVFFLLLILTLFVGV